jgi:hypothetical protein
MTTNTKQYGPKGVRQIRVPLDSIDTESENTGWRKPNKEHQETLKHIFLGGSSGLSVSNGIQILDKESGLGQKIIHDGVSTVAALKECAATGLSTQAGVTVKRVELGFCPMCDGIYDEVWMIPMMKDRQKTHFFYFHNDKNSFCKKIKCSALTFNI